MNENDILLVRESIIEYCEGIYGECLNYMKKNNIKYDLSGDDELSKLLRKLDNIKNTIGEVDVMDELLSFREECFRISDNIRKMIGG